MHKLLSIWTGIFPRYVSFTVKGKQLSKRGLKLSSLRRCPASPKTSASYPNLPDYNTSVHVHSHRLKRPQKPPPSIAKWSGLDALKERTKGSLIPETLKQMEEDGDFKLTAAKLKELGQKKLTKEERKLRQRALTHLNIPDFVTFWNDQKQIYAATVQDGANHLVKKKVEILQANIGLYCNQACNHCHVESSPKRLEMMSHDVANRCLHILENSPSVHTLDLTGGAPELNSEFRTLVEGGQKLGKKVIVRSNLTSLSEPGQETTAEFMADLGVHIVASLPCYSAKNVNQQRGKGVFDKSIYALLKLNELGYGKADTRLVLDLVYNPIGGFLPPPQKELEKKYKQELMDMFRIEFNELFTITNMPIKRFADFLYRRNELENYMELLVRNYNIHTMDNLMCRNLLSVNWNGNLHDCDFNQQLAIDMYGLGKQGALTVWDISSVDELEGIKILTDNHCFGCTAGMGSS